MTSRRRFMARTSAAIDELVTQLALEPAERADVPKRMARYNRDCGCAMGGVFMVAALLTLARLPRRDGPFCHRRHRYRYRVRHGQLPGRQGRRALGGLGQARAAPAFALQTGVTRRLMPGSGRPCESAGNGANATKY